ncbi:hypothetical protein HK100_010044 [Physocladia obscura]|uniref:RING-type domain-containing protein n=1 Tax=Physocladia obscura TaxID=109957 RepID=A0AAD5XDY6_9FUNG|nr:hypothetical protein HK100_010044 [Physocladia obscura]
MRIATLISLFTLLLAFPTIVPAQQTALSDTHLVQAVSSPSPLSLESLPGSHLRRRNAYTEGQEAQSLIHGVNNNIEEIDINIKNNDINSNIKNHQHDPNVPLLTLTDADRERLIDEFCRQNNIVRADLTREQHDALIERFKFLEQHRGHEAQHAEMAMILFVSLILFQVVLTIWKRMHLSSFNLVSLMGLWLVPAGIGYSAGNYRFIIIWSAFSVTNGIVIRRAIFETPMRSETPKLVYRWYSYIYSASVIVGGAGYFFTFAPFFSLPSIIFGVSEEAEISMFRGGVTILFYALYFGMLGRDFVDRLSDRMAMMMGYYTRTGLPKKQLRSNVCAICGESTLNARIMVIGGGGIDPEKRRRFSLMLGFGGKTVTAAGSSSKEDVVRMNCGHPFHEDCIRGWTIIGKKDCCPYCKEKVDMKAFSRHAWDSTVEQFHALRGKLEKRRMLTMASNASTNTSIGTGTPVSDRIVQVHGGKHGGGGRSAGVGIGVGVVGGEHETTATSTLTITTSPVTATSVTTAPTTATVQSRRTALAVPLSVLPVELQSTQTSAATTAAIKTTAATLQLPPPQPAAVSTSSVVTINIAVADDVETGPDSCSNVNSKELTPNANANVNPAQTNISGKVDFGAQTSDNLQPNRHAAALPQQYRYFHQQTPRPAANASSNVNNNSIRSTPPSNTARYYSNSQLQQKSNIFQQPQPQFQPYPNLPPLWNIPHQQLSQHQHQHQHQQQQHQQQIPVYPQQPHSQLGFAPYSPNQQPFNTQSQHYYAAPVVPVVSRNQTVLKSPSHLNVPSTTQLAFSAKHLNDSTSLSIHQGETAGSLDVEQEQKQNLDHDHDGEHQHDHGSTKEFALDSLSSPRNAPILDGDDSVGGASNNDNTVVADDDCDGGSAESETAVVASVDMTFISLLKHQIVQKISKVQSPALPSSIPSRSITASRGSKGPQKFISSRTSFTTLPFAWKQQQQQQQMLFSQQQQQQQQQFYSFQQQQQQHQFRHQLSMHFQQQFYQAPQHNQLYPIQSVASPLPSSSISLSAVASSTTPQMSPQFLNQPLPYHNQQHIQEGVVAGNSGYMGGHISSGSYSYPMLPTDPIHHNTQPPPPPWLFGGTADQVVEMGLVPGGVGPVFVWKKKNSRRGKKKPKQQLQQQHLLQQQQQLLHDQHRWNSNNSASSTTAETIEGGDGSNESFSVSASFSSTASPIVDAALAATADSIPTTESTTAFVMEVMVAENGNSSHIVAAKKYNENRDENVGEKGVSGDTGYEQHAVLVSMAAKGNVLGDDRKGVEDENKSGEDEQQVVKTYDLANNGGNGSFNSNNAANESIVAPVDNAVVASPLSTTEIFDSTTRRTNSKRRKGGNGLSGWAPRSPKKPLSDEFPVKLKLQSDFQTESIPFAVVVPKQHEKLNNGVALSNGGGYTCNDITDGVGNILDGESSVLNPDLEHEAALGSIEKVVPVIEAGDNGNQQNLTIQQPPATKRVLKAVSVTRSNIPAPQGPFFRLGDLFSIVKKQVDENNNDVLDAILEAFGFTKSDDGPWSLLNKLQSEIFAIGTASSDKRRHFLIPSILFSKIHEIVVKTVRERTKDAIFDLEPFVVSMPTALSIESSNSAQLPTATTNNLKSYARAVRMKPTATTKPPLKSQPHLLQPVVVFSDIIGIQVSSHDDYAAVSKALEKHKKEMRRIEKDARETLILKRQLAEAASVVSAAPVNGTVILSLDIEAYEHDQDKILEVGWTLYNPKMTGTALISKHFICEENQHLANGRYVPDNRNEFRFGDTEIESLDYIIDLLKVDLNVDVTATKDARTAPAVLVGHAVSGDIAWLKKVCGIDLRVVEKNEENCDDDGSGGVLGSTIGIAAVAATVKVGGKDGLKNKKYDSGSGDEVSDENFAVSEKHGEGEEIQYIFDTAELDCGLNGRLKAQKFSVKKMCLGLEIIDEESDVPLHNAGNDAYLTMQAFLKMAAIATSSSSVPTSSTSASLSLF